MKRLIKALITSRWFPVLLYCFIRLYGSTLRLKVENEAAWIDELSRGGRVILCAWHQQFFAPIRHFKNYSHFAPSLMISRSKDGEMIAKVANLSGWYTARGSSSRGGREALDEMIDRVRSTGLGAHILDGPTGPAGVVKKGIIKMALQTGAVVVPVYTEADKSFYAGSWDRFMIPKPFSKVTIRYGEPMRFEKTDSITVMEEYRQHLETVMRPFLKGF